MVNNSSKNIEHWKQKPNIFSRLWTKIDDIKKALSYNPPEAENVVKLKWWEEINEMKEQGGFIDEKNFRLQIGKMQNDGNTIYSPLMLGFWIEYIANHIKLNEDWKWKAVIQLRWDLAKLLLQEDNNEEQDIWNKQDDKKILSYDEEKTIIEKLIKKKLWKKWKCIEIQNVAVNYPDVFKALQKWKEWIIPTKEPELKSLKIPLDSPLKIIEFLAYHCTKEPKLMEMFYNTKPAKYIWEDVQKWKKPWDSDSDFYSVVEVGIRLYEILNWISIQWWIWRQRVYDKIISMILFWEDRIGKAGDYWITKVLEINDYPSIEKLHQRVDENYKDNKMQQLYIDLNENTLWKIKSNLDKKIDIKSKLKKAWIAIALAACLWTTIKAYVNDKIEKRKEQEKEMISQTRQQYRFELNSQNESWWYMYYDFCCNYLASQQNLLMAEYNISPYSNKEYDELFWVDYNDILEHYRIEFWAHLHDPEHPDRLLSADEFMKMYAWYLIDSHLMPPQAPYEHFKVYKDEIQNTLKYWNTINISNCRIEEITDSGRPEISYFIRDNDGPIDANNFYRLKVMRVYPKEWNGKSVDLIFGCKTYFSTVWYPNEINDYTLENWVICMKDCQAQHPEIFE